ncbi:hypothetical protein P9112_009644 [Eukaryota sp. TZLM1-RC]
MAACITVLSPAEEIVSVLCDYCMFEKHVSAAKVFNRMKIPLLLDTHNVIKLSIPIKKFSVTYSDRPKDKQYSLFCIKVVIKSNYSDYLLNTPSVSRLFTRSCALNALLTPTAVKQFRADLPLVTEICDEVSFSLQSFFLNFPMASRALVEQNAWCFFMTAITNTTGSFPNPSTSKGQRQLLHIFYSGSLPKYPQDRSLVSTWENAQVPYRNSFNIFLND